jgi:hypothetical protein
VAVEFRYCPWCPTPQRRKLAAFVARPEPRRATLLAELRSLVRR